MQERGVSADGVIYAPTSTADLIISVFCLRRLPTHCQHFSQIFSSSIASPPCVFFNAVIFLRRTPYIFKWTNKVKQTNKFGVPCLSFSISTSPYASFSLAIPVCTLFISQENHLEREREREKVWGCPWKESVFTDAETLAYSELSHSSAAYFWSAALHTLLL